MAPTPRAKPCDLNISASPGLRGGRVTKLVSAAAGSRSPLPQSAVLDVTQKFSKLHASSPPSALAGRNRLLSSTGSRSTTITQYYKPSPKTQQTHHSQSENTNVRRQLIISSQDVSNDAQDQGLVTGPAIQTPSQNTSQYDQQAEFNEETHFSLQDFFYPTFPLPCQPRNDGEGSTYADGFSNIDLLSVNQCLLSITPTMQEVPLHHKEEKNMNQMELLQSQARTERELSGIPADRSFGI